MALWRHGGCQAIKEHGLVSWEVWRGDVITPHHTAVKWCAAICPLVKKCGESPAPLPTHRSPCAKYTTHITHKKIMFCSAFLKTNFFVVLDGVQL